MKVHKVANRVERGRCGGVQNGHIGHLALHILLPSERIFLYLMKF